jgi:hypothetical protein
VVTGQKGGIQQMGVKDERGKSLIGILAASVQFIIIYRHTTFALVKCL